MRSCVRTALCPLDEGGSWWMRQGAQGSALVDGEEAAGAVHWARHLFDYCSTPPAHTLRLLSRLFCKTLLRRPVRPGIIRAHRILRNVRHQGTWAAS